MTTPTPYDVLAAHGAKKRVDATEAEKEMLTDKLSELINMIEEKELPAGTRALLIKIIEQLIGGDLDLLNRLALDTGMLSLDTVYDLAVKHPDIEKSRAMAILRVRDPKIKFEDDGRETAHANAAKTVLELERASTDDTKPTPTAGDDKAKATELTDANRIILRDIATTIRKVGKHRSKLHTPNTVTLLVSNHLFADFEDAAPAIDKITGMSTKRAADAE